MYLISKKCSSLNVKLLHYNIKVRSWTRHSVGKRQELRVPDFHTMFMGDVGKEIIADVGVERGHIKRDKHYQGFHF